MSAFGILSFLFLVFLLQFILNRIDTLSSEADAAISAELLLKYRSSSDNEREFLRLKHEFLTRSGRRLAPLVIRDASDEISWYASQARRAILENRAVCR